MTGVPADAVLTNRQIAGIAAADAVLAAALCGLLLWLIHAGLHLAAIALGPPSLVLVHLLPEVMERWLLRLQGRHG